MNPVIAVFQRFRALAHDGSEEEGGNCPLMLQRWTWLAAAFAFLVLATLTRFNG